jgi:hypothetical protein
MLVKRIFDSQLSDYFGNRCEKIQTRGTFSIMIQPNTVPSNWLLFTEGKKTQLKIFDNV